MAELNLSNLLESGSTIPFDQVEIEAVMRKILYENGITDVLYEGSNISQLTSVISYVIGSLNVNTAINLQETILPLATKRMNALFGARQLGYEPHPKKSYKYTITLTPQYDETKTIIDVNGDLVVNTLDTTPRTIELVQNTVFQSGNKLYYYKGETIDLFSFSNFDIQNQKVLGTGNGDEEDFFVEVDVVEGILTEFSDDPTLEFIARDYTDENGNQVVRQDFLIPLHDVEEDGLQVFVEKIDYTQAPVNGIRPYDRIERTKSSHYLIDETFTYDQNKFIRQENIILQYPVVFFEYSGMGEPVDSGDRILVNVFQTSGANGLAEDPFIVKDTTASSLFKIIPEATTLLAKGSDEESMSSIKQNATVFNNTANRAITKLDYLAITNRHSAVFSSDVWGGEDETPTQLGHIWTSTVPEYEKNYVYTAKAAPELEKYELDLGTTLTGDAVNLNNWYQSQYNENSIIDRLNFYKVMTFQLHHRHPMYVNFDFLVDIVKYDMTKSKTEINKKVFDGINTYFIDQIEKFDSDYLNSNLQRTLDTILTYQSGIGYEIKVSGTLFKEMKNDFYYYMMDEATGEWIPDPAKLPLPTKIHATLDFPFENMFVDVEDGHLDPSLLPTIDTELFGNFDTGVDDGSNTGTNIRGKTLYVNYNLLQPLTISENTLGTDIIYDGVKDAGTGVITGGTIVGTYTVNRSRSMIELEFDFETAVLEDEVFGISPDLALPIDELTNPLTEYAYFDIHYPYSSGYNHNIPFAKNTMPRLRNVEFKDN